MWIIDLKQMQQYDGTQVTLRGGHTQEGWSKGGAWHGGLGEMVGKGWEDKYGADNIHTCIDMQK
jgi:hypothetical protein